jgi:hypothetical protein
MVLWNSKWRSVPFEKQTKVKEISNFYHVPFPGSDVCRDRCKGSLPIPCCPPGRITTPIRRSKSRQHASVSILADSLSSQLDATWSSGDEDEDRRRDEAWDATVNGPFEYKHTLYPQRMIGTWPEYPGYGDSPEPPTRSRGLHTNHILFWQRSSHASRLQYHEVARLP